MNSNHAITVKHRGPNLGVLAIIFAALLTPASTLSYRSHPARRTSLVRGSPRRP
jgi:hypothetical protein